ncbi:hypothetical protein ABPG72_005383 [Tetrahymena utriculariae]
MNKDQSIILQSLPFNGPLQQNQRANQNDHERMMSIFTQHKDEDVHILSNQDDQTEKEETHSSLFLTQYQKKSTFQSEIHKNKILFQSKEDNNILETKNLAQKESITKENSQDDEQVEQKSQHVFNLSDSKKTIEDKVLLKQYYNKYFVSRRSQYLKTELYSIGSKKRTNMEDNNSNYQNNEETPIFVRQQTLLNDKNNLNLFIIFKLKIFMQKFLSLLSKAKFKKLRNYHFAVLNDAALRRQQTEYYYTSNEQNSQKQQTKKQNNLKKQKNVKDY